MAKRKTGRKRDLIESDPWARLPDLYECLLDEHVQDSKNNIDVLTAYYKHNELKHLHKSKHLQLWKLVNQLVSASERKHFGRLWQTQDAHLERVMAYYEWQKLMWHKAPRECRFIYQAAFPDFLVVLQCRQYGIGLPHDTCLLNIRTKFVKYFKDYFICLREGITYEDLYILKGHKTLYEDVDREYAYYFAKIREALASCPSAVYQGSPFLANCVTEADT